MSKSEANLNSSFVDIRNLDNVFEIGDTSQNSMSRESWDAFKYYPLTKQSASMQDKKWLNVSIRVIKAFVYVFLFCSVLCTGLIAKFVVLFAVSQLKDEATVQFCNYDSGKNENLQARISKKAKIVWTWYIIFMFLIPECFTIFRAIWYFLFKKKVKLPGRRSIAVSLVLEILHPVGVALLIFYELPKLNSVDAAVIFSCICVIPSLLNLLAQNRKNTSNMFLLILIINFLALIAQGTGVILLCFIHNPQDFQGWVLFIALVLSSCRWWCNYVPCSSYYGSLNFLARSKTDNWHVFRGYMALWRCLIFISSAVVISTFEGIRINEFFGFIYDNRYTVEVIKTSSSRTNVNVLIAFSDKSVPLNSFLMQAFCAFFIYKAAKFAYQTGMHKFGFALPLTLITPGTVIIILMFCIARENDPCALHGLIPDYLFLNAPKFNSITEFLLNWRVWCWLSLWLSQVWITRQVWLGEHAKLAPVERIFHNPSYDAFFVDQFLGLNKRKHDDSHTVKKEDEEEEDEEKEEDSISEFEMIPSTLSRTSTNEKPNTCVTQIYACATMWHENKEEMSELIGSILRLDRDQCAMKVTQKYYNICIKNYYELETHVIFDDAFCCIHDCVGPCEHHENETQVNNYVATFVELMQERIRNLGILDLPPVKCPTPYGGQLIWNLPGKTRLTVHLKDKNKIRHRKRWSQVMYMYYLLGYRLMGSTLIDVDTKELIAQNTYILTLDGDVDFQPAAVKALVDLMKKNKELGAACGRIHPLGKGPMIWFQKFEYAVGHWLQKSTEHTIGSVLCSPGCFSLFRAKVLMQHNIIAKYATRSTEPKHYIQYDQGEDRWLCTLILQAGCKVEYCAASDAYTHAPESFKEFYIQRRRWIPSTMANVFDLLSSSSQTRKLNDDISWLYIAYQWILTGSAIIGPSFIYLMMVGAFVTSFQLDNWLSFFYNAIPIIVFIFICFFCKVRMQLIAAEVITVMYGTVMLVVLVGILLQIASDGYFSPNTLLFFIVIGQFTLTGFMHPQELSCLPNAIIYYLTVPSMYMLLIIFSIFNLHNITWGTRESKSQRQISNQGVANQSAQDETTENMWTKPSFSDLFKCNICKPSHNKKVEYLEYINNSINEINLRLKQIESQFDVVTSDGNREQSKTYSDKLKLQITEDSDTSTDTETEISDHVYPCDRLEGTNFLVNLHWLQDDRLRNGKVDFLPYAEEEFWNQLIKKYLHPIEIDAEKQQKIARGLIKIRDECLLKFFMINIMFIVGIFLLQINKDVLYVQWPFAVEYNITYPEEYEVHVLRKYMHLEPIGCLFIVAFVFILFIQFLAMFSHRFKTFTHIIANAKLKFPCFNKEDPLSSDSITSIHAKNIAEGLQHITETQTFNLMNKERFNSGKRKTVRELIETNKSTPKLSSNFEVLFNKTLREPDTSGLSKRISSTMPQGIMEALEKRRLTILAENDKLGSENNASNSADSSRRSTHNIYDNPSFLNDNDGRI